MVVKLCGRGPSVAAEAEKSKRVGGGRAARYMALNVAGQDVQTRANTPTRHFTRSRHAANGPLSRSTPILDLCYT